MGAKKGKGGVGGKARDVAKHMSESTIKDFLHKADANYSAGFLRKCAEEGVDPDALSKAAVGDLGLALDTGMAGGSAGALSGHDAKSRIVNAIRGALGGGAAGGAAGGLLGA